MPEVLNIAAYRFVSLPKELLPAWREAFQQKAQACNLKGTVILSPEGINLFLSGVREAIDKFKAFLATYPDFQDLVYKESLSEDVPFQHLYIKLKQEIIPMGMPDVRPEEQTAEYVDPETLKDWYDQGRDMVILDTRNDYEVALGTFDQAISLQLKHFHDFAAAIKKLPDAMKEKPIVTFCTGGVRCEKAAELMRQEGFSHVYQLTGGILNYFEHCGGEHYHGDCFVFDKRVAVNSNLQPSTAMVCYECQQKPEEIRTTEACSYCEMIREKAV